MKTIETAIDTVNKFGDTSTIFKLDLKDDNEYVPLDDKKVVLNVANDTGLVLTTPMTTFSGHTVMVDFSSHGLAELTPDSYNLEIEVTYSDGDVSKFPTKGGLKFNITNNLKETTGALVPTVTFDNVLEAVDEKIAVYMDTVKVGPQGPQGPAGNVDTSHDNTFTGVNKFTKLIDGAFQTRQATFTDFAAVAADMTGYAGSWVVDNKQITGSPTLSSNTYVVEVIAGSWSGNGIILISSIVSEEVYLARVDGSLQKWVKLSEDSTVVHNTGNETIVGDKTFTGQTTMRNGSYGLRVTNSGIQKTSDNGVTWVSI